MDPCGGGATISHVAVTEAAPPVAAPIRLYEKGSLLHRTAAELRALVGYRGLVRYLVRSELRSSTTGRFFGFVWWLLDPFLLMGTYVVLVTVIFQRGGGDYPVFVFTSVHFAFGLAVLMVFALLFGIYPAPIDLLIVPLVGIQFILTLGIAFLLAALNIFMRDIQNLIVYVFRVMFFLSPAIYSLDRVPEEYRKFFQINPLTPLFEAYHNVVVDQQLPNFVALGWLLLGSSVGLMFGYLVFVKLERLFNKVL